MESNAAFVWADSIVVLNAVTTVYANRTVSSSQQTRNMTTRSGSALAQDFPVMVNRLISDVREDALGYFLHSLMELSLTRIAFAHALHEGLD